LISRSEGERLCVAVDATPLISGDTGVARYTFEHLTNLRQRDDITVKAFAVGRGAAPPHHLGVRRVPIPLRVAHRAWAIARHPTAENLVGRSDVVHAIDMVPPPTRSALVMTVHDALPLERPELHGPRLIRIARATRDAASRARLVVTTCDATAEQLVIQGYTTAERIVVAPPGPRSRPEGLGPPVIEPPYILAVGSITLRKNFDVLADAARFLPADAPPIIIAGPDGWQADEVRRRISELGVGNRVRLLGRVDDTTLDSLYRHASVFCHPSRAEGFGIPCLEAMALGVPVVAADIPSVRELGGGAIDLVPAGDPAALAAALETVLRDPAKQTAMSAAGRRRSSAFSWEQMTAQIVDAYRMALS
jgi:glycosyltransferase involved in cell wall biosynthesis